MKTIILEDAIKDLSSRIEIRDYFDNLEFKEDEVLNFIFPDDCSTLKVDVVEAIAEKLKFKNLKLEEKDNGYYLSSKNYKYLYLYKIKNNVETFDVLKETQIIGQRVFSDNMIKRVNVHSKNVIVLDHAFYFSSVEEVNFIDNENVYLSWFSFAYLNNLNHLSFSEANYVFASSAFAYSKFDSFTIPRNITLLDGCFKDCNINKLFVPYNVLDLACTKLSLNTEIFYEGDGNKLLLQHEIDEDIETPDDYSHNFHSSSGSFSTTHIHEDEKYAVGEKYHSFVKLDEFKKMIKN